jgi:predicted permease
MRKLLAALRNRLTGRNVEHELDDELRFHIEMETEANRARGLSAREARRRALADLGSRRSTVEGVSDVRLVRAGAWLREVRLALRRFRREPVLVIGAVATLALGIGLNTAAVTIAYGLSLRDLPGIADPDALVRLRILRVGDYAGWLSFRASRVADVRALDDVFAGVAGASGSGVDVSLDGLPVRAEAEFVTAGYFQMLGTPMARGRALGDPASGLPEVVLSHELWRRFDPEETRDLGVHLSINGHPFSVVGVTRPGFRGVEPIVEERTPPLRLWVPAGFRNTVTGAPASGDYDVVARLRPGMTIERATARLDPLATMWGQESRVTAAPEVWPLGGALPMGLVLRGLILLAIPAVVLLVACANLSALLLARELGRTHEVATCRALGASRWDVVRQRLVESALLALGGGVAALAVAYWTSRWLVSALLLPGIDVSPDRTILLATFGICALAVLLFGMLPAVAASRMSPAPVIRAASGMGAPPRRARWQRGLVVAQIALSLMLLASGSTVFSTVRALAAGMTPGFDVSPAILTASIDLDSHPYSEDGRRVFLGNLLEALGALPDVEAAAVAEAPPFVRRLYFTFSNSLEPSASGVRVSYDYFRTLGLPLVAGRDFETSDTAGTPAVAIVSAGMAATYWPGRSALGQTFSINTSGSGGPSDVPVTIVGVAGDVDLEDRKPSFYVPFQQHFWSSGGYGWEQITVLARGAGNRPPAIEGIREAVRGIDSGLSVFDVVTVKALADRLTERERGLSLVVAVLGVLTLVLAVGGTFSVMAFAAAQRRREAGIRLALGARPADVTRVGLRDGAVVAGLGLAIGAALAFAATRVLGAWMVPDQPVGYDVAGLVLAVVAAAVFIACYLPARRASLIDPASVLRAE